MENIDSLEEYKENIGKMTYKKSAKPFKSKSGINTIIDVILHPVINVPAYLFKEDDSYVECRKCIIFE